MEVVQRWEASSSTQSSNDLFSTVFPGIESLVKNLPAVFLLNSVKAQAQLITKRSSEVRSWLFVKVGNGVFYFTYDCPNTDSAGKEENLTPDVVGMLASLIVYKALAREFPEDWSGHYQCLYDHAILRSDCDLFIDALGSPVQT